MRVVSFQFSALGTVSYDVPADTTIVGFVSSYTAVLSTDPSLTAATIQAPSASGIRDDLIILTRALGGSGINTVGQLNIPVSKGRRLFVACASAGSVQLLLEDDVIVS